jgi:hypothetical protein
VGGRYVIYQQTEQQQTAQMTGERRTAELWKNRKMKFQEKS